MSKYNWNIIQIDYDSGLSLRDLTKKYGMSSRTLTIAVRRRNLTTRKIKGYETELDRCKWKQFADQLIVWKKTELKKIGVVP